MPKPSRPSLPVRLFWWALLGILPAWLRGQERADFAGTAAQTAPGVVVVCQISPVSQGGGGLFNARHGRIQQTAELLCPAAGKQMGSPIPPERACDLPYRAAERDCARGCGDAGVGTILEDHAARPSTHLEQSSQFSCGIARKGHRAHCLARKQDGRGLPLRDRSCRTSDSFPDGPVRRVHSR